VVPGDDEHQRRHVKAEAILAGKKVEEFSAEQGPPGYTLFFAVVPGFGKYFFMGHRPGYTGYWNGKDEKPINRLGSIHEKDDAISLPYDALPWLAVG